MTLTAKILAVLCTVVLGVVITNTAMNRLVAKGDAQGYARAVAEYKDRELQAVRAARAEEQRKTQAVKEIADEAHQQLLAVRNAHADAERAGQRLRAQLAAATRALSARASDPAPAAGSAPADTTGDLLADLQRRLDEAADATIRFADESRVSGLGCERAYDAVTPYPRTGLGLKPRL